MSGSHESPSATMVIDTYKQGVTDGVLLMISCESPSATTIIDAYKQGIADGMKQATTTIFGEHPRETLRVLSAWNLELANVESPADFVQQAGVDIAVGRSLLSSVVDGAMGVLGSARSRSRTPPRGR